MDKQYDMNLKSMSHKRKGQSNLFTIGGLTAAIVALIVLVVTNSIGADILDRLGQQQEVNSTALNITNAGGQALQDVSDFYGIIVTVLLSVFIIGLLLAAFGRLVGRV